MTKAKRMMVHSQTFTLFSLAIFSVLFLVTTNAISGEELFHKNIVLGDGCTLEIKTTTSNSVVLDLQCTRKHLVHTEIPWAGIRDEDIQNVILVGNIRAYFVTAWDRSSTYGAQTNIIVWKNEGKWKLKEAPFTRGFVEDENKDGVFELIDYYPKKKVYRFDNGNFVPIGE